MGLYRISANSPRNYHLSFAPHTDLEGSADSIAMLEKNPLVKPYLQQGKKIPVTILGATGVVGQRFLRRLANHPWFFPTFLAASEKSAGRRYDEACAWHLDGEPWAGMGSVTVTACTPEEAYAPIVFSALDAEPARQIEPLFAQAGAYVFSNASAFRMEDDVPLLIPELNPDHLSMLEYQQKKRGWKGAIVTNPNCTTVMIASALAPLEKAFGIEAVIVTSMQAISGAGYPGVSAMDITGNVIPFIKNEEPKVEIESNKILGRVAALGEKMEFTNASFAMSATCTRVPVLEGHTISISVRLKGKPSLDEVHYALQNFIPATSGYELPSAPEQFLELTPLENRPQPRRDAEKDSGMRIVVGRVRECPIMGFKLVSMGHNTERGAAGASVLNAEIALAMGVLR